MLCLVLILISYTGLQSILIVGGIALGVLLFLLRKHNYLILLFAFNLPLNGLFHKHDYIFGVLNYDIVINALVTISLLSLKTSKSYNNIGRLVVKVLYVFWIYTVYTFFNSAISGLSSITLEQAFHKSIYFSFHYWPLILIVMYWNDKISNNIINGLKLSSIFLAVSLAGANLFNIDNINFALAKVGDEISAYRHAGFYGLGDTNSLGIFFVLILGYNYFLYEAKSKKNIFNIEFLTSIIGLLLTGSRASMLAFLLISLIFILRNKTQYTVKYIILLVLLIFIVYPLVNRSVTRFSNFHTQFDTSTTSNRIGKWIAYSNFFAEHPISILIVGREAVLVGKDFRAAHNAIIQMIFNAGILPIVILTILYFKFTISSKRELLGGKTRIIKSYKYILLPFLFNILSVSEFGVLYFYLIYIYDINFRTYE